MKRIALVLLALMFAVPAFAQKVTVKVINRQNSDRTYGYLVANRKAALGQTFDLQGATMTLQLADGRVAVVNCKGMDKSSVVIRRDCRVPLIDTLDADFHGVDRLTGKVISQTLAREVLYPVTHIATYLKPIAFQGTVTLRIGASSSPTI